ncbi:MAG: hypothetical protein R3D84_10730 [Paracoccaceae bacterium]
MPIPRKLLTLAALAGAMLACILAALVAAKVMERRSLLAVSQAWSPPISALSVSKLTGCRYI